MRTKHLSPSKLNYIIDKARNVVLKALLPKRFYASDALVTSHNHSFMEDDAFKSSYARGVQAYGSNPSVYWRLHIHLWATSFAMTNSEKDSIFVEFGVNKGLFASAILATGIKNKFYLFDAWDGGYETDYDSVHNNFFEWDNTNLVRGYLPETLYYLPDSPIAYAHFDLNDGKTEVKTFLAMKHLLADNAVVVLDDYAYAGFEASKVAWDELKLNILSLPTGQGVFVWRNTK